MADFFGKVKDGFNKGVATVSTGSKTMIEKSKLNTIIKSLEDEKKQLAEILGNKVYNYCMQNPDADIPRAEAEEICGEINARIERINQEKIKIEQLDAEMNKVMGNSSGMGMPAICSCGNTNAPGAKFCAKCGNKIG